jgi:hypothetical protein
MGQQGWQIGQIRGQIGQINKNERTPINTRELFHNISGITGCMNKYEGA